MVRYVLLNTKDWLLIRFGFGEAISLENKKTKKELFFQGDDADRFFIELETVTSLNPDMSFEEAVATVAGLYDI